MRKDFKDMSLSELSVARGTLVNYIAVGVAKARRTGSTWASIGAQLGVSTQEAHRRYSYVDKIISRESNSSAE